MIDLTLRTEFLEICEYYDPDPGCDVPIDFPGSGSVFLNTEMDLKLSNLEIEVIWRSR